LLTSISKVKSVVRIIATVKSPESTFLSHKKLKIYKEISGADEYTLQSKFA
jgi:hypothetical protein